MSLKSEVEGKRDSHPSTAEDALHAHTRNRTCDVTGSYSYMLKVVRIAYCPTYFREVHMRWEQKISTSVVWKWKLKESNYSTTLQQFVWRQFRHTFSHIDEHSKLECESGEIAARNIRHIRIVDAQCVKYSSDTTFAFDVDIKYAFSLIVATLLLLLFDRIIFIVSSSVPCASGAHTYTCYWWRVHAYGVPPFHIRHWNIGDTTQTDVGFPFVFMTYVCQNKHDGLSSWRSCPTFTHLYVLRSCGHTCATLCTCLHHTTNYHTYIISKLSILTDRHNSHSLSGTCTNTWIHYFLMNRFAFYLCFSFRPVGPDLFWQTTKEK